MLSIRDYLIDTRNYIELVMYICAVIYVAPGESPKTSGQITAGAISVFLAWIYFSLILKTISGYGLYITMAMKVFKTVWMVCWRILFFLNCSVGMFASCFLTDWVAQSNNSRKQSAVLNFIFCCNLLKQRHNQPNCLVLLSKS